MTIQTTDNDPSFRGPRHYFDDRAPEIKYPGVTNIVGMTPKQFLQRWNANMAADYAVENADILPRMVERDPKAAKQAIAGAAYRYTKKRSEIGSQAHDLFERLIRGENIGRVHPDMVPYVAHFREFLDAVNPELVRAEDVAWSDTHQYAGSFDAILRIWLDEKNQHTPDRSGTPYLVMVDWKTSKKAYPEVALQMSAYAYADEIISPDGTREPMPEFDAAFVLHITDSDWEFIPADIDRDTVFAQFLHLRKTWVWDRVTSKHVLGKPTARKGGAIQTGTQRRAK
jgi:hypothetical protein